MLTTAPYLRTRRPSPTTAEFIVSTLPPMTVLLRLALCAIYLLRLVLALGVLLLLYSAWAQSPYAAAIPPSPASPTPPSPTPLETASLNTNTNSNASSAPPLNDSPLPTLLSAALLQQTLHTILSSRLGTISHTLAATLPPWVLVPASAAALYTLSQRIGAEERLLVLRGLGIQTSSSGRTLFSSLRTRFIPTDKIRDVLLNEAFRGFEVRHCLVVVVEGEDELVVVFPTLLPRPRVLEKVWRGARECLFEGGGVKGNGRV
ncbi:GPI-GlcNAc transferase complex, PIG-H component-domain-containing protein [Hypoxylon sp. NC1633]|nr:GPI-GlcNAc transferase complex, PIG-H component-domain-containing protein [Hypoxylon sp. NC1633]